VAELAAREDAWRSFGDAPS